MSSVTDFSLSWDSMRRRRVASIVPFPEVMTPPANRSYQAGDVVKGELAFVLPAKNAGVYWGDGKEFAGRLKESSNPWKMVSDEQVYNLQLPATVSAGKLLKKYPLEIQA